MYHCHKPVHRFQPDSSDFLVYLTSLKSYISIDRRQISRILKEFYDFLGTERGQVLIKAAKFEKNTTLNIIVFIHLLLYLYEYIIYSLECIALSV